MRRRLSTLAMLVLVGAPLADARAQCSDSASVWYSVLSVGTQADDRQRVAQDRGRCATHGSLIRSAASLTPPLGRSGATRWSLVAPLVDATWNSSLPYSMNDGPVFASRGLSTSVATGVRFESGRLSMSLVPQLTYEQNRLFQVLPGRAADRSAFASPWHSGVESADLPLRFGTEPRTQLFPGESWMEVATGALAIGASTDEQWWGPGVRNALVLSNNAAGVPEGYVRTRRPLHTRAGDVEFRILLGGLSESRFFDTVSTNDVRSLSAAVATLRVAFDTGLTVGVARAVYAPTRGASHVASHALDVFAKWNQTAAVSGPAPADSSEQLLSLFGRWVFPSSGVEIYGEWAKLFAPGLRELLVDPRRHRGYTLGLQWVNDLGVSAAFRLQAEITSLEQTPPSRAATIPIFYTSRVVPQGYTQRGQVLGAAIGPGGTSQFLAADRLGDRWRIGLELNRIRWEDEAYYQTQNGVSFLAHDVSLIGGIRCGLTASGTDFDLEVLGTHRINYLFQSPLGGYAANSAFDIKSMTLRLRVTPR